MFCISIRFGGFWGYLRAAPNSTKTNQCEAFSKAFQADGAASQACRTGLHIYKFKVSVNIELLAFSTTFNLEVEAAQDVNSSNNSLMFLAVFVSLRDSSLLSSPWLMLDRNTAPSLSHSLRALFSTSPFCLPVFILTPNPESVGL